MNLISKRLFDLSNKSSGNRTGHVSCYQLSNNNLYNVFFIEERYFGFDELDKYNKIIKQGRSLDEYDYRLDCYFSDESRCLGNFEDIFN